MYSIKSLIFQDLTSTSVETIYFNSSNIPFEFDMNHMRSGNFLDYCNKEFVVRMKFLGFNNNTIFYVGKFSHKIQECRYFHYFVLMIYNVLENSGIFIKSPFTKHISWFHHKMFLDLKFSLCYDIYKFFYMQDIVLQPL